MTTSSYISMCHNREYLINDEINLLDSKLDSCGKDSGKTVSELSNVLITTITNMLTINKNFESEEREFIKAEGNSNCMTEFASFRSTGEIELIYGLFLVIKTLLQSLAAKTSLPDDAYEMVHNAALHLVQTMKNFRKIQYSD
jgi:hypothetical protein